MRKMSETRNITLLLQSTFLGASIQTGRTCDAAWTAVLVLLTIHISFLYNNMSPEVFQVASHHVHVLADNSKFSGPAPCLSGGHPERPTRGRRGVRFARLHSAERVDGAFAQANHEVDVGEKGDTTVSKYFSRAAHTKTSSQSSGAETALLGSKPTLVVRKRQV
ncbi:hypothetical protein BDZ89DRAFT_132154 [Hymenopellis radicata]|nr:hypothetical protein BDZ89DRAFT_132154 [Hymenopellis radicata]